MNENAQPWWLKGRVILVAGIFLIAVLTMFFYAVVMDIEREVAVTSRMDEAAQVADKPVVYVGVISRYRPRIIYRGYQPIMDYLTAQTPYRFELRLSREYNQTLDDLISQRVSAVFLGSYLYVQAHARHGVIPILKPLNENRQPVSRSVLITRASSEIRSTGDLIGKRLALPSTESFSSHWLLDYELPRQGLQPSDLALVRHFPHHHNVIAEVLSGDFDAGVTREYLVKDLVNSSLRAVLYSDPIPSSPITVAASHDQEVVQAMKEALLAVNRDEARRARITRDWDGEFVNGFVEASDADYASIRAIVGHGAGQRVAGQLRGGRK